MDFNNNFTMITTEESQVINGGGFGLATAMLLGTVCVAGAATLVKGSGY